VQVQVLVQVQVQVQVQMQEKLLQPIMALVVMMDHPLPLLTMITVWCRTLESPSDAPPVA
jgi:hypothetical protein